MKEPEHSGYAQTSGSHGLPKIMLTAPDGAQADVYLHGGHMTAWTPAGGEERLFLSKQAEFGPGSAIRGGVPVIFPQFAERGTLALKHGFARREEWSFAGAELTPDGGVLGHFKLEDNAATRATWPYAFQLELAVRVGGPRLEMTLKVHNPGSLEFDFSAALHTYLRVAEIAGAGVEGLRDHSFIDSTARPAREDRQTDELLRFSGEVDRIYAGAPDRLVLHDGARRLRVEKQGFPDVVVWNPGAAVGAGLADLEPEGYQHFVCIEAGAVLNRIILNSGESWQGQQSFTIL
jgi:glucose-6-phosphate 1-epimerase